MQILDDVSSVFGFRRQRIAEGERVRPGMDLVVYEHGSDFHPADFDASFRATHIIRDPRDVVVSGYNYHLWTDEEWAHSPRVEYDGRSYQEFLNSLPRDEGLAAEIRFGSSATYPCFADAKWDDPRVLTVRYEDLIADEAAWFATIFRHYGFHEAAVEACVAIAENHTFSRKTGRQLGQLAGGSHLRSGAAGQWRTELSKQHTELFEELNPGLLAALGYED